VSPDTREAGRAAVLVDGAGKLIANLTDVVRCGLGGWADRNLGRVDERWAGGIDDRLGISTDGDAVTVLAHEEWVPTVGIDETRE
jgi:hypothetical protein